MFKKLFGKPTKDEFARSIMDAAERSGFSDPIVFDPERFQLRIGGADSTHQFNLHNVYQEYLSAGPLLRRTLLHRYVAMMEIVSAETVPATFRQAQPNLLPRVRERSYHGITRLQFEVDGLDASPTAHRLLAEHLVVELAYDLPDAITTIAESTLGEWGVGLDLALDVATRNLLEGSPRAFVCPVPGVHVSAWKDNHDASRLVLLELIRELEVDGDPVAMVPHRDVLIVTGSDDARGLAKMAELTEALLPEARFMTAIPVRLRWDEWVEFRLAKEHPLHHRFELLRAQTILRDYSDQKEWLDRRNEKLGNDVFVASYTATQDPGTGRVQSYCVWSKDVVSLLPRADTVHFYDDDRGKSGGIVASASWERVREVAGALMRCEGMCPPRYFVEDFPSREQLDLLRESSVASAS